MTTPTEHLDAKEPVTVLAGPYGHPIHPLLVTVPIGAWVMSLVFDIVSFPATDKTVWVKGALWLIGAGVLAALLAALFGFLDLFAIPRGTRAFTVALTHMTLNLLIVASFAVNFGIRYNDADVGVRNNAGFVMSIVTLVALAVSGYLGGMLAYRFGVRVAAEEVQADGFRHAPATRRRAPADRGRMARPGPAPG